MREIGKGYEGIQNVARCMNIFSISDTTFHSLNEQLQVAYENAATISMKNAVNETKLTEVQTEAGLSDHLHSCRVAVDGTWQKKEPSSLNGVVSAMSNGKCIDFHVMFKHCKQCSIWESRETIQIIIMNNGKLCVKEVVNVKLIT